MIRISDNLRNQRSSIEVQIREKEIRYREESQIKKDIQTKKMEHQQKIALLGRQKQKISQIKDELLGLYKCDYVVVKNNLYPISHSFRISPDGNRS